jgi:hypothetical protein
MSSKLFREYKKTLGAMKATNRIATLLVGCMNSCPKAEQERFVRDLVSVIDVAAFVDADRLEKYKPTEFKDGV